MYATDRNGSYPVLDGEVIAEVRGVELCRDGNGRTFWDGDKPRGVYVIKKSLDTALACGHEVAKGEVAIHFFPEDKVVCLSCAERFDESEEDEGDAEDRAWSTYVAAVRQINPIDVAVTAAEVLSGEDQNPLVDFIARLVGDPPPDLDRVAVYEAEAIGRHVAALALDLLRRKVRATATVATF